MLDGLTIAVVVPAYDEARLIGRTLEGVPRFVDRIIVVDDGSTDGTRYLVEAASRDVELVVHSENRGVGAAIATGCRVALELGVDAVVVMAGDGQMAPEDLPAILTPLIRREADFVTGNRLHWPGARSAMPLHRWVGNHTLSFLTRLALGTASGDSQCGYVALNDRALRAIDWERLWPGYGYPNDLLGHVLRNELRVREVAVRPVYAEETSGIRWWHALGTIPFVIVRAWLRRRCSGAIERPWPTSTSSTAMQTASARSPSSGMPIRETQR